MSLDKQEHRYLDIISTYSLSNPYAKYFKQYDSNILEKANDYTLAVDRFNIPMSSIPIFIFDSHQTNGLYDYYTVELEYNNTFSGQTGVQYITTTPTTQDPSLYYRVYTFSQMIMMVNNAIKTAFNTLNGLTTLPVGSSAPFFTFDATTSLIAYNAPSALYDTFMTNPIKLYMNQNLWVFFDGISIIETGSITGTPSVNGRDVQFMAYELYNNHILFNSIDHYTMITDTGADTAISWNIAKGYYFISNTLPIRSEIMPNLTNNYVNEEAIVCNFDFVFDSKAPKPMIVQYILQTPYKLIDFFDNKNINKLDIQVFWYDKYNNSYPLTLHPKDAMTIRLLFQSKK